MKSILSMKKGELEIIRDEADVLAKKVVAEGKLEDLRALVYKIFDFYDISKTEMSSEDKDVVSFYMLQLEEYSSINTVAGVYLPTDITKHRRFNDLLLERAAPGQVLPEDDILSIRSYKGMDTPYAQSSEMNHAGLETGRGGNQYTLVNTADAPINNICSSGHQLLVGNENTAKHYGMSLREAERAGFPGVRVGQWIIRNVTSCDHYKKTRK